jgi:hypothetical protein
MKTESTGGYHDAVRARQQQRNVRPARSRSLERGEPRPQLARFDPACRHHPRRRVAHHPTTRSGSACDAGRHGSGGGAWREPRCTPRDLWAGPGAGPVHMARRACFMRYAHDVLSRRNFHQVAVVVGRGGLTPKLSCKRSTQYAARLVARDSIAIGGNRNASADLALVGCSDTLDRRRHTSLSLRERRLPTVILTVVSLRQ